MDKKSLTSSPFTLLAGLLLTLAGIYVLLLAPDLRLPGLAALAVGSGIIFLQRHWQGDH